MAGKPEQRTRLNRRQLLATLGLSAIAGCASNQKEISSTSSSNNEKGWTENLQTDCVDRERYDQLRDRYDELRDQHIELQERVRYAKSPPYILTDRRSIAVTYETLDGEIESWQWDSSALSGQITSGHFIRTLTHSQLEYLGWDDFGFRDGNKYTRLGDFGSYYQLNPFVVPSNFTPLSENLYNRHSTNLERIRAAWNFTTQLNDYVSEIEETPRFPLETLLMGGGDCEDSAILLGSLLYSMPADWVVSFWYIDIDNPTDPENINHVILSVETEQGATLIETTSDRMRPYDQVNGFSIEIEPSEGFNG